MIRNNTYNAFKVLIIEKQFVVNFRILLFRKYLVKYKLEICLTSSTVEYIGRSQHSILY